MTDEEYQTLVEQVNANTQAIEEIKEVLAEMYEASEAPSRVTALERGLASCSCEEMWANLYNKDLAKFSLNGTTLNITLPITEE